MSIIKLGYEKIPPEPVKDNARSARNSRSTRPATTSPSKHRSLGINNLVAQLGGPHASGSKNASFSEGSDYSVEKSHESDTGDRTLGIGHWGSYTGDRTLGNVHRGPDNPKTALPKLAG
jgi:hypothetical protein